MCACSVFVTPWTVALQAPVTLGFSRQEYWNRLPFPTPRDLPDPGIEPSSFVSLHWNWGKDLSTQGPRCRLPPTSLLPCLQGTCAMYQALCKHQDFPGSARGKESACQRVQSLGWKKEVASHSSILAWKIPWTEEPGRLQSTGSQRDNIDYVNSVTV